MVQSARNLALSVVSRPTDPHNHDAYVAVASAVARAGPACYISGGLVCSCGGTLNFTWSEMDNKTTANCKSCEIGWS